MWDLMTNAIKVLPGQTLMWDGLFFVLLMSVVFFGYAQIRHGFENAKSSYDMFSSLSMEAKIRRQNADKLTEAVKERTEKPR